MLISCPDCGTKYRFSAQRLKEGKSRLRCRKCGRIISLRRKQPSRSLKVQVIRTDQRESEASETRQPVFQTYSGKPDTRKRRVFLLASAATGMLVLIATGIFFGYPLLFHKGPPGHSARETPFRAAKSTEGVGKEPFILLEADLPALRRELQKRLPFIIDDPNWRFASAVLAVSEIQRMKLLLYPDPENQMLPVLILQGNESADLKKPLLHSDPWERILLPAEGNAYRFNPMVLETAAKSGFPAKSYRIWFHPGWAVCAPLKQSQLWEGGTERWHSLAVARFAEALEKPIQLAGLSVRIPQNLPRGWTNSLIPDSLRRSDRDSRQAIAAAADFLALLDRSMQQIDSMAGVFRFLGDKGRQLQYAQQFREGFDAIPVFNRLQSGENQNDHESIVATFGELLHHDRLNTTIELHESRLTVGLQWQAEDDQALMQAVIEAVFSPKHAQKPTRP